MFYLVPVESSAPRLLVSTGHRIDIYEPDEMITYDVTTGSIVALAYLAKDDNVFWADSNHRLWSWINNTKVFREVES